MDATLGAGGHAQALLERGPGIRLLGIDRDPDALERARGALAAFSGRVELVLADFGDLDGVLEAFPPADGILADLGVSSMQLNEAERGFSFRRDGPLDMRMGKTGRSAADIVATASVEELTRIFREFGEERMAAKIARGIVAERAAGPSLPPGNLRGSSRNTRAAGKKSIPPPGSFRLCASRSIRSCRRSRVFSRRPSGA